MSKAILINSLAKGGAERVAVNLFKALNFDYLIVFNDNIIYDIPKERVISLDIPPTTSISRKILNLLKRIFLVEKIKREKNINLCLSLLEPANLINVLTKGNGKCIISFHTNYINSFKNNPSFGDGFRRKIIIFLYKIMLKLIYNRADIKIVVSNSIKEDLVKYFGLENIKVLYNPFYIKEIQEKAKELPEKIFLNSSYLITVGRLSKPKGQWYLLRIYKELKKKFPKLKLVLLGEGELKNYLVNLSENLGLRTYVWDRDKLSKDFDVYFLGFKRNPYKYISHSEIFIFPSLWEGFPNALVEAMACGVPVVSADCRSGPREILAPDTDFNYQTDKPEFAKYGILMPPFEVKFKNANEPLERKELLW